MTQLLIIQTSALGDLVQGLRAATALKTQLPDLRISWIVRDTMAPLVRSCEAVDHIHVFHRSAGVVGFWRLMCEVRQTTFDWAFDYQGLLRTGLMLFRARAAQKAGRPDAREYATFLYPRKAPFPDGVKRGFLLDHLRQFGPFVGATNELDGHLSFREVAGLSLGHLDGPGGTAPIVMFPDSRRIEKRWNGFKQLTDLILRADRRARVVWAGQNYIPDKDAFLPEQFLNLTGNTSLVALPALIKHAAWVIANENGPMHLTAALDRPLIAILGRSDPQVFGPYPMRNSKSHVVQAPVGDLRLLQAKEVFARFRRLTSGAPVA